jgi:hypothetical protein
VRFIFLQGEQRATKQRTPRVASNLAQFSGQQLQNGVDLDTLDSLISTTRWTLRMPPKKKARTQSIKDDFLDDVASTSSHLSSASSSHDLTPEQLARAYGLARPRAGTLDSEVLQRTCPPKWREDSTKSKSPEIITIESDDEEEESKPKPLKNLKRGSKGKGKEVEKVSCSGEHCSNTPRCLNWLGQDKWEDSGEWTRTRRGTTAWKAVDEPFLQ